ncbi:MAG: hypothetical protein IJW50_08250 [Clostridia bacterium]|nr:hypothetical protein [Clostridia bacterium]
MGKKIRFSRTDVRGHTDAITQKGREARAGGFEPRLKKTFHTRVIALLCAFCFVIAVYAIDLIALQAAGNAYSVFDPASEPVAALTKTVTLQAPRGEIYDRNGNKLVTNATFYAATLDYNAFYAMGGMEMRNRALLQLLETTQMSQEEQAASSWQFTLAEEMFPLEGEYPSLRFTAAAMDPSSETYRALQSTLSYLGAEGSSAQQIVQYYVSMYALDSRVDGIPLYSDEEILSLIRLYYNMDRCEFSPDQSYTLATRIGVSLMSEMQKLGVSGLHFFATQTRLHLYDGYASHLLGELVNTEASNPDFCNALGYPVNEIKGKSGCEGAFDSYLQGVDGEMEITYDAHGNILSRRVLTSPTAGQDVYLTIDIHLQIAAEDALRVNIATVSNTGSALSGADCNAGAVVALDPETGEVLAMGSYPTYNNIIQIALPEDGSASSPYINRATSSLYTPSELFHLCTAIAGLDQSKLSADTMRSDLGIFSAGTTDILCPLYEKFDVTHESLNVSTALTDGCEVFFATLGESIGIDYLNAYGRSLGLGQATGIEISESTGALAGPEYSAQAGLSAWSDSMTPLAAVGLSDHLCTPLQLCSMLSTILQGGDRVAVRLFGDTRSYISGTILEMGDTTLLSRMRLNREDVNIVIDSMKTSAMANTLLMAKTAALRESGVEIGYLGADSVFGTMNSQNALLLAFGSQKNTESPSTKDIAVCVVLEHGADPTLASPTAAAVLNTYFGILPNE